MHYSDWHVGPEQSLRMHMNALLVTGGYPWTVIPVEQRKSYMSALAQASTHRNIVPFAQFLGKLISEQRDRPLERPANRVAAG